MQSPGIAFVIKSKNIFIYLKSIINQKISVWLAFSTAPSRVLQLMSSYKSCHLFIIDCISIDTSITTDRCLLSTT